MFRMEIAYGEMATVVSIWIEHNGHASIFPSRAAISILSTRVDATSLNESVNLIMNTHELPMLHWLQKEDTHLAFETCFEGAVGAYVTPITHITVDGDLH